MKGSVSCGLLESDGKRWVLSQTPPDVSIMLKRMFPRVSTVQLGTFSWPRTPANGYELEWFFQRYPPLCEASVARDLAKQAKAHKQLLEGIDRLTAAGVHSGEHLTLAALAPGATVRGYQAAAGDLLEMRKSLLLGDDLGLGKTFSAAAFMCRPGALPAAVVVQGHLQTQFAEVIRGFTNLKVVEVQGTRPVALPECDVVIFRYSQISGWVDTFRESKFKTVVYDEIQDLRRGTDSQKGIAAAELSAHAEYRLGLSATPIYNYGDEIHSIYKFLDRDLLGTIVEFRREWCDEWGRVRDPEALGVYLRRQGVFLRRTKAEVGQQVPPVNRIVEPIPSDSDAIASIEEMAATLARRTMVGSFMERGRAGRELDLLVRQATGVGKARHVAAYVRILAEAGVPVVVAAWHREVYRVLMSDLGNLSPVMYTGTESVTQKRAAVEAFTSGKTKIFIISLRSGAGLDGLQFASSTVVFAELDYSPGIHQQVIGRLDREGQTEPVNAIFLNSDDGSDPVMVELLGLKASQAQGVVDPGQVFSSTHTDISRIKAIAARFLSQKEMQQLQAAQPDSEIAA